MLCLVMVSITAPGKAIRTRFLKKIPDGAKSQEDNKAGLHGQGNGGVISSRKDQVDMSWLEVTQNVSGCIG